MTVTPPPLPVATPPPQQGGSSGCFKWGCIGCLAVIIVFGIGAAGLMMFVLGIVKSTDVYRDAAATAKKDPRVIQALGSPVREGFWVIGTVNTHDHAGEADITFPIKGPQGNARVHAVASKEEGTWHYSELTVTPSNGPEIDLLKP